MLPRPIRLLLDFPLALALTVLLGNGLYRRKLFGRDVVSLGSSRRRTTGS